MKLIRVDNRKHKKLSRRERKLAYQFGYSYKTFKKFGLTKDKGKDYVSIRDYLYIFPINMGYQKWLKNLVTIHAMLQPYQDNMLEFYYHLTKRDGKRFVIPLSSDKNTFEYQDLLELLLEKQSLNIITVKGNVVARLTAQNNQFYWNEEEWTAASIVHWIETNKGEYIIVENERNKLNAQSGDISTLHLYVANENGDNARILDGMSNDLECFEEISKTVVGLSNYLPQLAFMGITVRVCGANYYIRDIVNQPRYFEEELPSLELTEYLQKKLKEKRLSYQNNKNVVVRCVGVVRRFIRRRFARAFYPKGLKPYLSYTWIRDVFIDCMTQKQISFREKIYAYRNGFLSYRLEQYGIVEETREKYISDFEYKWIRHINSSYRVWLEDKNTLKYMVLKYKDAFPDYYYYVGHRNGEIRILGLLDCPSKGKSNMEDILELIRDKKVVALKPDEGSHGDGFYRCEYMDDKFYLNFKEVSDREIIDILSEEKNSYIITEYIQMHDELKKIYSGSVNTLRAIVFKKDGRTPEIGNVYMRIGTSQTGTIDNMSAGGMFAEVNEITGEYGNAKRFVDGNIIDCKVHPDSQVLIEGVLPNWAETKELILNIAAEIKQIEFFGFDLAITNDGIKIPEINRSPDFPKIEKYTEKTNEYLLYKLERKKEIYGYQNNKCRKLFGLPKR